MARGLLLVVVAVIFFNWLVDESNRPAWVTSSELYPQLSQWGTTLLEAIPDDPEADIRGACEEYGDTPANTGSEPLQRQNQEGLDQLIDGASGNGEAGGNAITPAPADPGTNGVNN